MSVGELEPLMWYLNVYIDVKGAGKGASKVDLTTYQSQFLNGFLADSND